MDGTLKKQLNKIGMTTQHFHNILTSCAILPSMPCVCCVHSRVVEGSGEGSVGRKLHIDVHRDLE